MADRPSPFFRLNARLGERRCDFILLTWWVRVLVFFGVHSWVCEVGGALLLAFFSQALEFATAPQHFGGVSRLALAPTAIAPKDANVVELVRVVEPGVGRWWDAVVGSAVVLGGKEQPSTVSLVWHP